mgnify:CR=1 FL=1
MDNTSTDTQCERAKAASIDYWLLIDGVDAELSGLPLKYRSSEQVSAALGVGRKWVDVILHKRRKALRSINTSNDMMR